MPEPGIERVAMSDVWVNSTDQDIDVHVSASVGTGDLDGPGGHWVGIPQVTVEIGGFNGTVTDLGWVMPQDAIDLGRMLVAAGEAAKAASERIRPTDHEHRYEGPDDVCSVCGDEGQHRYDAGREADQ